jgi:hypothetical protein
MSFRRNVLSRRDIAVDVGEHQNLAGGETRSIRGAVRNVDMSCAIDTDLSECDRKQRVATL